MTLDPIETAKAFITDLDWNQSDTIQAVATLAIAWGIRSAIRWVLVKRNGKPGKKLIKPVNQLPAAVLRNIASFMPVRDLCSFRKTNKTICKAVDHPTILSKADFAPWLAYYRLHPDRLTAISEDDAKHDFLPLAAAHNPDAALMLWFWCGRWDPDSALKWGRQAAKLGSPLAHFELASALALGSSHADALTMLAKAAALGDLNGMFDYAVSNLPAVYPFREEYTRGISFLRLEPANSERSKELLEKCVAQFQDADAMRYLGQIHYNARNMAKAFEYFLMAAKGQHDLRAISQVILLHRESRKLEKALKYAQIMRLISHGGKEPSMFAALKTTLSSADSENPEVARERKAKLERLKLAEHLCEELPEQVAAASKGKVSASAAKKASLAKATAWLLKHKATPSLLELVAGSRNL